MLPRLPRQLRLRLAGDESPIDRPDPFLLGNGQHRVKRATHRTDHVLGADYRPVVLLKPRHLTLEVLRPAIVMKRDYVRLAQLNLLQFTQVGSVTRDVDGPHAAGERLHGIRFTAPTRTLAAEAPLPGRSYRRSGIRQHRVRLSNHYRS